MAEGEVRQYWVRNDRGTMWGPLTLPTIELLVESGSIKGKLQVSEDGINFAFPWRFPEARDVFPRALWGDGAPNAPAPAPGAISLGPTPEAGPGGMPGAVTPGAAPMAGPGAAHMAGPGAAPMAGPGAAPMAGPGAAPRAGPGAAPMAGPGARPMAGPGAVPMAGPGTRPAAGAAPMAGPGTRPPVGTGAAPMAGGAPMAGPGAAQSMAGPGAQANVDPARRPTAPPQPGVARAVQRPPVAGAAPGAPGATAPGAVPGTPPGAVPGRPPVPPQPAGPTAARGATAPTPAPFPNPMAAPAAPGPAVVAADASPYAVPSQGPLDQFSPIRLYGRIAAGEQTGLLSLTLPDRVAHIHFRKGNPEFVDSSHPEDALGTSLMGAKLLTPEQLQQAESSRARFGGDLLAALFGQGLLQPASAFTHLAQRAVLIMAKGLRAESGTFTFEPRDLPGQKAMPLGNRWAVLSDAVRRLPPADLKRRLAPVLQLPIMKSGGLVAASELRLTPHEVRTLAVIDGVRSVAQLLNDFPQDGDHLLRIAFLLRELDAVSFAAPSRSAAVAPPPGAQATPQPAAPPPGAQTTPQRPAAPQPATAATPQRPTAPQPAPGAPRPPPVVGPATASPPRPAGAVPGAPAARPAPPVMHAAPGAGRPPVVNAGPGAAPAPRPASPPPGAARPPAATPPGAAPTATAAPATGPGSEEIPALRQLVMAMKQQNHFQRLGLTEQTNSSAVKIAYFRLAKLYHPDTLPQGAPPDLEKLKAEVFAYIGDAYRMLSDDKSRAQYIEELKAGGGAGTEVDINSILMAEELFQKSCILVKARKFAEAVKMLDEAIKLNAEEAEFYAWRGYARFFTAADKKAAQPEAFREIQNAIKRNERCAPAHYFLGVIAKLCGDAPGALKHFKRTVELQPDHIDAQREIRMSTQKK
jgi:hypothetical protein